MTDTIVEAGGVPSVPRKALRCACLMLVTVLAFAGLTTYGMAAPVEQFPISVKQQGTTTVHMVSAANVEDALKQAGYQVGMDNFIRPALDKPVEADDLITIYSMGETYTVEEKIPYETFISYSPQIPSGTEDVLVEGEEGIISRTCMMLYEDGKSEEVVLDERTLSDPTHKQVVAGFPAEPVSKLDFGYSFDKSFAPVGYKRLLTNQRATGYTSSDGARTSTGRVAAVGHVAVNPDIIPYGTKLFITSADGRFIYGYAIAADTGASLKQGVIDVDLYYNTVAECTKNGMRSVNIYIL